MAATLPGRPKHPVLLLRSARADSEDRHRDGNLGRSFERREQREFLSATSVLTETSVSGSVPSFLIVRYAAPGRLVPMEARAQGRSITRSRASGLHQARP